MKIVLPLFTFLLSLAAADAQSGSSDAIVLPEVTRNDRVQIEDDTKFVTVKNTSKQYLLSCNTKAAGCMTPDPNKKIQNWAVTYKDGENIALVSEAGGAPSEVGLYLLRPTNVRNFYENITNSDGPIIYGTGLSDDDRAKAWKQFFMQIVEAGIQQQGVDFKQKLARKCLPGNNFCSVMVDVDLVGVGGIQEPRKIIVIVGTDINDEDKQVFRSVCIYSTQGTMVCRDWDTGRLINRDNKLP